MIYFFPNINKLKYFDLINTFFYSLAKLNFFCWKFYFVCVEREIEPFFSGCAYYTDYRVKYFYPILELLPGGLVSIDKWNLMLTWFLSIVYHFPKFPYILSNRNIQYPHFVGRISLLVWQINNFIKSGEKKLWNLISFITNNKQKQRHQWAEPMKFAASAKIV